MTHDSSAAPASGYDNGDDDLTRTIRTGDAQCWLDDPERELGAAYRVSDGARPSPHLWRKQVFLPSCANERLEAHNLRALPGCNEATDALQGKEGQQIVQWRTMATEKFCGCRDLVIGTAGQVRAVRDFSGIAPNFGILAEVFAEALLASHVTQTPLSVPPILLLGPPGVGKTFMSGQIGSAFLAVSMTTTTAVNPLGGTEMVWKSPKMGMVAKALLDGGTACPVILLDEIDKCFAISGEASPLDPLHALLEPETARNFRDEYLEFSIAADAVIWIATANSIDNIAPSILDRMLVLHVAAPGPDQMRSVIASIHRGVIAGFDG